MLKNSLNASLAVCLSLLFTPQITKAINLIPNGDFEKYTTLPTNSGQIQKAKGWSGCAGINGQLGSPDYFHTDAIGTIVHLPNPFVCTVYPPTVESHAIAGIALYFPWINDFREYLSHQLLNPTPTNPLNHSLTVGATYELTFKVTNGMSPPVYGGYGVDHFSVAFSTGKLFQNSSVISVTPQYTYPGTLYSNTWTTLTYTFVADKPYRYITFGSFVDDTIQQVKQYDVATLFDFAYYFIDDVQLMEKVASGINNITINPSTENTEPKPNEIVTFSAYDFSGRLLFKNDRAPYGEIQVGEELRDHDSLNQYILCVFENEAKKPYTKKIWVGNN